MNLQKNLLLCLALSSVLSACNLASSPDDLAKPKIDLDPKMEEFLKQLQACNKPDSELDLAKTDFDETLIVKDKIESKETVDVDCEKKETPLGKKPVRSLYQNITVEAPIELVEPVNFVRVSNPRTCSSQNIDAGTDSVVEDIQSTTDGKVQTVSPEFTVSVLGKSGRLKLQIDDSNFKLNSIYLNVLDGNNPLTVQYYGKCLKYKSNKDEKLKDSNNCEEAELLAEKKVLLSIDVERPEVEGTRTRDMCIKKN